MAELPEIESQIRHRERQECRAVNFALRGGPGLEAGSGLSCWPSSLRASER